MNTQVTPQANIDNPFQYKHTDKPCCKNCIHAEILTTATKEDGIVWYCYKRQITVYSNQYCAKHEYSELWKK